MAMSTYEPAELARQLGYFDEQRPGKIVRDYLRNKYPDHPRYQRWVLDEAQAADVRVNVPEKASTNQTDDSPTAAHMVRVGGVERPREEILEYAADYLSDNGKWAYPAYDSFPGTPGDLVGEADLLAICLLNAGQKMVPAYYGMQKLLDAMNETLQSPSLQGDFTDAGSETLNAVAEIFGILDKYPTPHVGKTKLMKVLHRKRPSLIPLFDGNIRRCYSELGSKPVPSDSHRTHRDFAVEWLPVLQKDLREQRGFWDEVVSLAKPDVPITPLRAIDIVGWHMGRQSKQSTRSASLSG